MHLEPLLHAASQSGRDAPGIDPLKRAQMQRRVGLNLEGPLVTEPESLDVLVHFCDGEIETRAAVSLLAAQGVALPDAWLAVGRAHDIQADVIEEGLVGTQIGHDVCFTYEGFEGWMAQIHGTELEIHIARGLWLINQLKPMLPAHDIRELKARYVVHDIGKLGPLGLHPEAAHMVLHSFELRRIALHHAVAPVFAKHFGRHSHGLIAEINRQAQQTSIGPQTTMRDYFNYHEAWGGQRLAKLYAEGHVSDSVARHAHQHHHIDRSHASLGLITYMDMYEASTGRMSYDVVTGQETRRYHDEAMADIWQRFNRVDRCRMAPDRVSEYTHLLTIMDGLAPHLSVSPEHAQPLAFS